MTEDRPLKSAVELALERLEKKDAEAGVESRPLTDEQKAAIAEARNFCQAKLAETEVLHQSKLKTTSDPEQREALLQDYRRDCERLSSERDAKIERIRNA
jgi:hypothetical protein